MTKRKSPAPRTAKSKSKTTKDPAPAKPVYQSEVQKILASSPPKKGRSRKRETAKTLGVYDADRDILDQYLHEVSLTPLLTTPQEIAIAKLVRAGDQEAMQELVKRNLRFVISVAKKYQNRGLPLTDLIGEGNVGLLTAARKFDPDQGVKFISYAVWWIRQSILQALAEQSRIVRLPLNKVGLTNRIQKAYSQLEQEFEREPSAEELATVLELDIEEVSATLGISARHVSVDTPLAEGEDNTLLDVLENPNATKTDNELDHTESLKVEIERSLKTLTERQKEVICYFFGIGVDHPMSLEDIGEKFSLTRERVRQIKDKAITKLRTVNRCKLLRTYLGQ